MATQASPIVNTCHLVSILTPIILCNNIIKIKVDTSSAIVVAMAAPAMPKWCISSIFKPIFNIVARASSFKAISGRPIPENDAPMGKMVDPLIVLLNLENLSDCHSNYITKLGKIKENLLAKCDSASYPLIEWCFVSLVY
jgi:hypothetical protein